MSSEVFIVDEPADTRGCPFCGETIKAVAIKCRHCGELLGDPNSPGIFRHGRKVVASLTAPMPPVCIKTGQPTDKYLARELRWHHPLIYLGLLLGILPYLIGALLTQKKHRIRVYMTPQLMKRRRIGITLACVGAFGGIAAVIAGAVNANDNETLAGILFLIGVLGFLVGLILALIYSNPISAARIDDEHIWIKGAGKPFLATLPEWIGK
jgi:hypothetical protein